MSVVVRRLEHWRAHRLADVRPNIERGAWLLDLGMPTPRAVRIKRAYEIQQGRCSACDPEVEL